VQAKIVSLAIYRLKSNVSSLPRPIMTFALGGDSMRFSEALVRGSENERISIFDVVGYACLT
jgi:hypothetical protein